MFEGQVLDPKRRVQRLHQYDREIQAKRQKGIADTKSYEQWSDEGSKDAEQRAYERWTAMLESYEAPAIDPDVDEALNEFIDSKKREMADQWY